MKKIIGFLFCTFFVGAAHSQDGHLVTPANATVSIEKLSAADWQADLQFLQQTIHKDYSFLFKKVTAAEFDAAVDKLYKAMPGLEVHERVAGLARIISLFKYGHTSLGWRQGPFKYHVAPVNFYWFSNGLYVEGADKNYASIVGAKLLKIEGVPVMQVLEAIKPLVSAENEQFFKAYGLDFIAIPEALHAQGITK
ncbi:MAG: hypothetical protein WBB06_02470, partial [Chitinophagaceae bacterium]